MYESSTGLGGGFIPTAGGIAVLPNTGSNELLFAAALLSTVIGSLILVSTAVRFAAKRFYKV